jgi:hypothetical protein
MRPCKLADESDSPGKAGLSKGLVMIFPTYQKIFFAACLLISQHAVFAAPSPETEAPRVTSPLAFGLTAAGTVVPVVAAILITNSDKENKYGAISGSLAVTGLLIGPSVGQFYARAPIPASIGIGVRVLGGGLVVAGLTSAFSRMGCAWNDGNCGDMSDGSGFILLGLATYTAGFIYSLADIPKAVRKHQVRQSDSDARFGWAPTLKYGHGGSLGTGASAWMHF